MRNLNQLAQVGQLDALLVLPKGPVLLSGNDSENREGDFCCVQGFGAETDLHYLVRVEGLVEDSKGVEENFKQEPTVEDVEIEHLSGNGALEDMSAFHEVRGGLQIGVARNWKEFGSNSLNLVNLILLQRKVGGQGPGHLPEAASDLLTSYQSFQVLPQNDREIRPFFFLSTFLLCAAGLMTQG